MNLENINASNEKELDNLKKAYKVIEGRESALLTFFNSVSQMMGVVEVTGTDVRNVIVNETAVQFKNRWELDARGIWASELGVPQEIIDQWVQRYHQAEREKRPIYFEYTFENDGAVRWLSVMVQFVERLSDEIIRCSFVIEDITEQKHVQRTLATLMSNLPGMAYRCLHDPDWTMLFVSEGSVKLTGYRAEELIENANVSYGSLVHPEDREYVWEGVETAVSQNLPFQLTYRIITKDGDIKWVWEQGRQVEMGVDGIGILEGFITDITKQKLAEAENQQKTTLLKNAQAQLIQQERLAAVGQLAAGIAHDFNNILAIIVLYTQLTQQSTTISPTDQSRLTTIIDQSDRAAHLVQQILDFSRQSPIDRKPLALRSFLKDLERLLRRTLPETIKLEFYYGNEEYEIKADSTRIQQLLMNLALNARDAMPNGGKLQFKLTRQSNQLIDECLNGEKGYTDWVTIHVTDTGHGMKPEIQQRIFEPFFTTKEIGQGTGLGLAQAYGIVKQHDGLITVSSKVNRGTQFTICLPAQTIQEDVPIPSDKELAKDDGELLLLVEDNEFTRQALKETLLTCNYQVVEAQNGQEALQLLTNYQGKIDLVLSDVVMPVMGGINLYNAIREKYPDVKIILMSGYAQQEDNSLWPIEKLSWLKKPFTIEKLTRSLSNALNSNA